MYLSFKQAAKFLKNRPTGSYVLRFSKDCLWTKKSPLFLALKFDQLVVHQTFAGMDLNVTSGKEEGVVARLDGKAFVKLGKILDFLPKAQVFAKEVVANKNFVDQTLGEAEVAEELNFKEYIIFPNMGEIVIHRKGKEEGETEGCVARVGIEWEKCHLYSLKQGNMEPLTNFNDFLLDFLEIKSTDRYEIMGVLGYNPQDMDSTANKTSNNKKQRQSPERVNFSQKTARFVLVIYYFFC